MYAIFTSLTFAEASSSEDRWEMPFAIPKEMLNIQIVLSHATGNQGPKEASDRFPSEEFLERIPNGPFAR